MTEMDRSVSGDAASTLRARIAQLGDAVGILRVNGRHDLANEVELHRDQLRRELAGVDPVPMELDKLTMSAIAGFLVTINDALTPPPMADAEAQRALMDDRLEWTRATIIAVLRGTQDIPFAMSFLAAQNARLQPDERPAAVDAEPS